MCKAGISAAALVLVVAAVASAAPVYLDFEKDGCVTEPGYTRVLTSNRVDNGTYVTLADGEQVGWVGWFDGSTTMSTTWPYIPDCPPLLRDHVNVGLTGEVFKIQNLIPGLYELTLYAADAKWKDKKTLFDIDQDNDGVNDMQVSIQWGGLGEISKTVQVNVSAAGVLAIHARKDPIQGSGGGGVCNGLGLVAIGDVPAVTDLAASPADWFSMDLGWTVPSSGTAVRVASYDLRYSTTPIVTQADFDAATPATGLPAATAPGTTQGFTVTGLSADTPYWFAMKCLDVLGTTSEMSNVATGTTSLLDVVAPAPVFDLAYGDLFATRVTLTWTDSGDDGTAGQAAGYELRYSTAPIDEANWTGAILAGGTPAVGAPGGSQSHTVTGLSPSTPYYFAVRYRDEVPNWSAPSNIVSFTTPDQDLIAPTAVQDLDVRSMGVDVAALSWTAPADYAAHGAGPYPAAGYDLRYSTTPIVDDASFAAAVPVPGPTPAAPGTLERFNVTGLSAGTIYYFAIKAYDLAEPANVSGLSNIDSGTTLPPVQPVTVKNPWLVNDRVADTHNLATMAATYVNAYTPDGVIPPANDAAKAINIYNNQKRRLYHWADEPPGVGGYGINDPTYLQNVFGWALCGRHAHNACTIAAAAGLGERKLAVPGDWQYELFYDGQWHLFHTMMTFYVYNRANPPAVASAAEIKADNSLVLDAVAEGRACPGYLLCGDLPETQASLVNNYSNYGSAVTETKWTGNMGIRLGQSFTRTWESWANQHPAAHTGAPDPPFHHEADRDWKDYVNLPYWEPYRVDMIYYGTGSPRATYRRWANGTDALAPDFRSAGYQAILEPTSTNLATYNDDGLSPDLHTATVGTLGEAIFKIDVPFYVTDANISGTFVRHASADVCKIYFSTTGTSWTQVYDAPIGTTEVASLNLRTNVFGRWGTYYIKVQMKATAARTDAGVSDLVIQSVFEHNKGAMAYLDKGVNRITVTFDNPAELAASNAVFRIVYKWKEYDGTDWTIDRIREQYVTSSPATFVINVGGTKVPRTEYILMEVTEPPMPDEFAPAPVTDLAAENVDAAHLDLTWTASGDDADEGTATSYDIRYATWPITPENFETATAVTEPPGPLPAGSAERFTVTGLLPSTTYHFALKVRDEGGNASAISNVIVVTTAAPDLTPPAAITDLRARPGTASGSIELTWTATGDDGLVGTASHYELRCSPEPITAANFEAATLLTTSAPQPAGTAESLAVSGLNWHQRYYFALRVGDEPEAGNVSALSNITHALATGLGTVTLQRGRDGYFGVRDTYSQAGTPTTNFSSLERMRVTGYAGSYGPTAVQRGYVRFDLSSLPADTTIASATLHLYSYNLSMIMGTSGFHGLYRLTQDWTESGLTWNNATASTAWTTPGGDIEATPDAITPRRSTIEVGWYEFDVTSRVREWIADGASNYGWAVRVTDEDISAQDEFYQSDAGNPDLRPKLVIVEAGAQPLPGDVDGDDEVSVLDIVAAVTRFGTVPGDENWLPEADSDADGEISVLDIVFIVTRFGDSR